MGRVIFFIIIFYLIYKFIFGFLIPVINASRQMRGGLKDMKSRMNEFERNQGANPTNGQQPKPTERPSSKDYIDFEEVKN